VRRALAPLSLATALASGEHEALAQVRWDAEVQAGVERRVLTSRPPGVVDAGPGPLLAASTHVALIPLLRVGLYLAYDASPVAALDARELVSGGVDVRLLSPWPRGSRRVYVRVGLGQVGMFSSAHGLLDGRAAGGSALVPAARGTFTEVPLAVGVLCRVTAPIWITAEAGARVGFGFGGGAYSPGGSVTNGDDSAAMFVDLGVMWGR